MSASEIVENPALPAVQGVEGFVKTTQPRRFDLLGLEFESGLDGNPIRVVVEDRRQRRAQHTGAD